MRNFRKSAIYVSDDNGWREGCPSFEEVFFGSPRGRDKATFMLSNCGAGDDTGCGYITIIGDRTTADAYATDLAGNGDWVAPEEVNVGGEATPPTYSVYEMPFRLWSEEEIRTFIESHEDDDRMDADEMRDMFASVYRRDPSDDEIEVLYSHVCNLVSHE